MDIEETDIMAIRMGPGGEAAAGRLAQARQNVTGVEAKLVGSEMPVLTVPAVQDDGSGGKPAG